MTSHKEAMNTGSVTPPRITSWHAAVFFQAFALMIQLLLGIWYTVVMVSPGSLSEYLPHELPATVATISETAPFSIIWAFVLYFTLKRNKGALLASTAYGVFFLIGLPLDLLTGIYPAPDFSDFILFPTVILLVIFSAMSYRSFPKKTPSSEDRC